MVDKLQKKVPFWTEICVGWNFLLFMCRPSKKQGNIPVVQTVKLANKKSKSKIDLNNQPVGTWRDKSWNLFHSCYHQSQGRLSWEEKQLSVINAVISFDRSMSWICPMSSVWRSQGRTDLERSILLLLFWSSWSSPPPTRLWWRRRRQLTWWKKLN